VVVVLAMMVAMGLGMPVAQPDPLGAGGGHETAAGGPSPQGGEGHDPPPAPLRRLQAVEWSDCGTNTFWLVHTFGETCQNCTTQEALFASTVCEDRAVVDGVEVKLCLNSIEQCDNGLWGFISHPKCTETTGSRAHTMESRYLAGETNCLNVFDPTSTTSSSPGGATTTTTPEPSDEAEVEVAYAGLEIDLTGVSEVDAFHGWAFRKGIITAFAAEGITGVELHDVRISDACFWGTLACSERRNGEGAGGGGAGGAGRLAGGRRQESVLWVGVTVTTNEDEVEDMVIAAQGTAFRNALQIEVSQAIPGASVYYIHAIEIDEPMPETPGTNFNRPRRRPQPQSSSSLLPLLSRASCAAPPSPRSS